MASVDFSISYEDANGNKQWVMTSSRLGFGCGHSGMAAKPTRKQFREFKRWSYAFLSKAHLYDENTFNVTDEGVMA